MGLGLAGFVGMWALMMAAMMLPSMARWPPCTTARCSPIARCG
jgi:predicted metal-binding membrane protein